MSESYDIAVFGSGISGSTLSIVLARMGLKVLVIESKTHPRFAIGESTIPTMTLMFNDIANKHDIPEFKEIFSYPTL